MKLEREQVELRVVLACGNDVLKASQLQEPTAEVLELSPIKGREIKPGRKRMTVHDVTIGN